MTGTELRRWRTDRWLSQTKLAELLRIHRSTVARWEAGEFDIPPYLDLALLYLDSAQHWGPTPAPIAPPARLNVKP